MQGACVHASIPEFPTIPLPTTALSDSGKVPRPSGCGQMWSNTHVTQEGKMVFFSHQQSSAHTRKEEGAILPASIAASRPA